MLTLPGLGRAVPVTPTALGPSEVARLAGILVLLLAILPVRWRSLVWVPIAAAAWLVGGSTAGGLATRPPAAAPTPHEPSAWVEAHGAGALRLTARPRAASADRWTAPARLLDWRGDRAVDATPRIGDGVLLRGDGPLPEAGALIGGAWRLRPPRRASVSGGFDEAAWLRGRDLTWVAYPVARDSLRRRADGSLVAAGGAVQSQIQRALRARLHAGLPPREAQLAGAVLLGGGAQPELREAFVRLGLAHLFALSGLHVGIVAGLLLVVIRPLVRRPTARWLVLSTALIGYAVLVDAPDSVVRAVGLVSTALGLRVAGRSVDGLRVLGCLLWLNVLWQPHAILDVGLRLSYLAAGGIVWGQRLVAVSLRRLPGPCRVPATAASVAIAAQLGTLPVVAESFGLLPLLGPVANVLAVAVFGAAASLLAGGLVLALAWPWAGEGLLTCGWAVLRPLQAATSVAGAGLGTFERGLEPWGAGRWLLYAAVIATLLLVLARASGRRRWGGAVVLYGVALLVATATPAAARARWLDQAEAWQFAVGQGDCALIRLPDGFTCLIDTGEAWPGGGGPLGRDVLPFLRRLNLRRLDAVVLTHGHADHTGGAPSLAGAVAVGRWYAGGRATPPGATPALLPAAGDTLHATGGWALLWVHPHGSGWLASGENDHSLSLALCRDGVLVGLWTGDLEAGGERAMLGHLPSTPGSGLPFWKAGHHGSSTSGSDLLLATVRPRLVVISCGVANRHRHPSRGPFADAAILRTDLHQTVHLTWDRHGRLRARTLQRPPSGSP